MNIISNIRKRLAVRNKIKNSKPVQFINKKRLKLENWILHSFQNTYRGVIFISMILCTSVIMGIVHMYFPSLSWVVCGILSLIGTVVVAELQGLIIRAVFGVKKRNRIYWFQQFFCILLCCMIAAQAEHFGSNIIFSVVETLILAWFGRSLWAVIKNKKHTVLVIISLVLTTVELGMTAYFLKSEGFKESYVSEYLNMAENQASVSKETLSLQTQDQNLYEVASLTYGTDANRTWMSKTMDLSTYMEREFPTKSSMKNHFGYDLTKVPLEGKVWYPINQKNCPVLFIIHGNHDYMTDSYLGYEYLGEYLAAYGYVVISVNENACNDLSNENDGRAVLLLENMKYIFDQNKDETSEWYQKLDEENVAIAGHSRGGEAVSEAYLFNGYDSYPENGNEKFQYHFNIKSVIAIAPTVDQYQPADHEVSIQDVNYLVLQGANDHDVSLAMGQKQYDHVTFTKNANYQKSLIYIADANHGQFNTEWGRYDLGYPVNDFLNVANLMTETTQQEILKTFLKTFLDVTLKGDTTNEGLLKNCQAYGTNLPKTVYQQVYQTSNYQCISNFEEDSNLTTATMDGAVIDTSHLKKWTEERVAFGDSSTKENFVLRAEWEDTKDAQIHFHLPEFGLQGRSIVFDLADMREEVSNQPALLDGEVILTDASGNTARARISDYTIVYPSLPVQLRKLDYIFGDYEYKHQFQTVTIPEMAYMQGDNKIDTTRIVKLTITFNQMDCGEIQLDNVGLE